MTFDEIRRRLDERDFGDEQGRDFVRSALIGQITAAVRDGHSPDSATGCPICNALAEMVAVYDIVWPPGERGQGSA